MSTANISRYLRPTPLTPIPLLFFSLFFFNFNISFYCFPTRASSAPYSEFAPHPASRPAGHLRAHGPSPWAMRFIKVLEEAGNGKAHTPSPR